MALRAKSLDPRPLRFERIIEGLFVGAQSRLREAQVAASEYGFANSSLSLEAKLSLRRGPPTNYENLDISLPSMLVLRLPFRWS